MYVVPVKVAKSNIDGSGVFAEANIAKNTIVWIYKDGHDIALTPNEYNLLSTEKKDVLEKTAYLSPWSGLWVFPPDNDPAQFTNHSPKNNLSVVYDSKVSTEPYFVANKDIRSGDELTNNYHDFDKITQQTKPAWAK
ncbi:SET domain-containing protein [Candidatus Saccharibacteria bacterium]|nr:SET domain-containing protein [Candidatus Saccharibacteria bacterium]MBI3338449.1 SET domain-containing protein [Candidatus Saccharibacteria bacterium]